MNGFRIESTNVGQYLDDVQNETIKTDQAVQRDFCWNNEMINNIISSAISQKVYIPNLILAEENKEEVTITYVVDGGHRTEALRRFKYSDYKITSMIRNPIVTYNKKKLDKNGKIIRDEYDDVVWETEEFDLRNKRYSDLPKELQRQFNKCPLMATIYQNCTTEETSNLVNLYNNHVGMNVSQKSLTYIGKFANEIKRIKDSSTFLKDSTALTETEKHKGNWERVINESVMAVFHMDEWKKDPKKMCDFLNDNSSLEEFRKIEEYFNRITPYSDKIDNKKVSELFVSKDMAVWMMVFDNFDKLNLPDENFGNFLNAFITMREFEVDGITWNELDMDKHTKDKSVLEHKVNHITYLMKEFLHIEEIESEENKNEVENNILKKTENEILSFVKENVDETVEKADIELYENMLDDCVRIDAPLYEKCKTALTALVAYACLKDKDEDFEKWIKQYEQRALTFSKNEHTNFSVMKNDFENYISA